MRIFALISLLFICCAETKYTSWHIEGKRNYPAQCTKDWNNFTYCVEPRYLLECKRFVTGWDYSYQYKEIQVEKEKFEQIKIGEWRNDL